MIARVRLAGWLDGLLALVVTMIVWPFPVLRASLSWAVHGPLIVTGILVADMALRTVSLMARGRTPFMYLLDVQVGDGDARFGPAVRWAAGWTLSLAPSLVGAHGLVHPETGLPARFSGLVTRSTR